MTRKDEERQRFYAEERRVWEKFKLSLAALSDWEEAEQLHRDAVPEGSPGRRYYSNFGFFLMTFGAPAEASYDELVLYAKFIQRLNDAPPLKPGATQKALAQLESAIRAKQPQ